jgi:hypothetical protein
LSVSESCPLPAPAAGSGSASGSGSAQLADTAPITSITCVVPATSSLRPGDSYSCPASVVCAGETIAFSSVRFGVTGGVVEWFSGGDSNCNGSPSIYQLYAYGGKATGTVPDRGIYNELLTASACQTDYSGYTYRTPTPVSTYTTGQCRYTRTTPAK